MNSVFRTLFFLVLAAGGSYLMVRHIDNPNIYIDIPNIYSSISLPDNTNDVCLVPERGICSLREIYPTNNIRLLDNSFIHHLVLNCHNSTHSWETVISV